MGGRDRTGTLICARVGTGVGLSGRPCIYGDTPLTLTRTGFSSCWYQSPSRTGFSPVPGFVESVPLVSGIVVLYRDSVK